ncbi:hypothetical protein FA15DRAFT_663658 [Coprinopsis marcescibilis]|uniref:F-box domain-containing protein n=1 Tax=Coprinopsis marcescibilis TaxID=230819 RepID=A0A5C3LBZ0_COPMA|nr:hypothetical protein FA15DRAFT_663658 [Coprinopsis marcescibilis]
MADVQEPLPVLITGQIQDAVAEPPTRPEPVTQLAVTERIELASVNMSDLLEESPAPVEDSVQDDAESAEDEDTPFDPELFPFHTEVFSVARVPRQQPFPFFGVQVPYFDDLALREVLPFAYELDFGVAFSGNFVVWQPEILEAELPFYTVNDDDMPKFLLGGNFVPFSSSFSQNEFSYNYLRGHTLHILRTASNYVPLKTGALQHVFKLPNEIILDILELVSPMDLLHVTRASKPLRALLLSKDSLHVWRTAFATFSTHPQKELCFPLPRLRSSAEDQLPTYYPPAKLAAMLYSEPRCDFCGKLGALIDFALEERYCNDCLMEMLEEPSDRSDIYEDLPRHDEVIWELLVPSFRQCGRSYQCRWSEDPSLARYRKKDIDTMKDELTRWFVTIDEGMMPDAGEKFEQWKKELKDKALAIKAYSVAISDWALSFYYKRYHDVTDRQQELAKKITKRLNKMGHDPRDTEAAESDIYCVLRYADVVRLKRRDFETHRAEFVEKVVQWKHDRLQKEREAIVCKSYDEYRRALKPEQWQYQPPVEVIKEESLFNQFIAQDVDKDPKELSPDAVAQIPKLAKDWVRLQRISIYEMLPGAQLPVPPEVTVEEGLSIAELEAKHKASQEEYDQTVDTLINSRMRLATAVFSCSRCKFARHSAKAIIGWESVCAHMCGSWPKAFHTNWEFCSVGYAAAASIIRMLGLDPEIATPEEVDAVDARFFCFNCPVTLHRKLRGRKVYTWRECVTHAVDKEEDHTHASPAWVRLSQDATTFSKAHELPFPNPQKPNWGCNHCSEHFDVAVRRKEAIKHVKTVHSIEVPVHGVDFIDFKHRFETGGAYRTRHTFHYSIEPACQLVCNLCTVGKVKRLRNVQGLVPHLFHKHGISMPSSVRDYSRIELLHE